MKQKLVIIDGKSVFYRGYYAMAYLTTSRGEPVGGIYGFTVLAFNIIKRLSPDYVAIAWDKSKTNIAARRRLYPDYKANRQPAPTEFYDQIPGLFRLLEGLGWPLYEFDDFEADDIMATLAVLAGKQPGLETILVSSDLDMLQILDETTKFYAIKRNLKHVEQFDVAAFRDKYGIEVSQFVDLKSLMGDSSDNVPGVRGIGPKAASELLKTYPDLEAIYDDIDQIPSKYRQKLIAGKDMAFLSRQLIELRRDAPVKLDLKKMAVSNCDQTKLLESLRGLEFYSLIKQLPPAIMAQPQTGFLQTNQANAPALPEIRHHKSWRSIDPQSWSGPVLVQAYCRGRFGQDPLWLLVSRDQKTADLYQIPEEPPPPLKWPTKIKVWGYNCQRTIQVLAHLGANLKNIEVVWDTKVIGFLLEPTHRQQSLSAQASHSIGYEAELDDLKPSEFADRAAMIVAVIRAVRQVQTKSLSKLPKLANLAKKVELPFIAVLAQVEINGIAFIPDKLDEISRLLEVKIKEFEKLIFTYAGEEFNVASQIQLSNILYGRLKLPTTGAGRARGAYKTDAAQLARLRSKHPIIDCLIGWREFSKLKNTYVDVLPKYRDPDGRIRTELQQTVAITGRLSSLRPNLQNIPTAVGIAAQIRAAFVAPPGRCLINADYSQFELRLAAVLADETDWLAAFAAGSDIHQLTAATVFGVEPADVDQRQRTIAKNVNFGVLYGQGPHSLAEQTGLTYSQASDFIDQYFAKRPKLVAYLNSIEEQARDQGFVETLFGRRRPLPEAVSRHQQIAQAARRQAVNFPVQGTEADLMKMAMINLWHQLDDDCLIVLQVHDSILLECPQKKTKPVAALVKQVMEGVDPDLGVDLKVDIKTGSDWSQV